MSKKCTALWRKAHLEVNSVKNWRSRSTFGSWGVEKVHAVVARSTFASQNVQNTWVSEHFWKLRCRKSARRCGAKHICKWKCTKHTMVGPLLEVEMSKKCTALWSEADLEVKCVKNCGLGAVLEVEMTKKCTALWREAHVQVKMYKTHHVRTTFWRFRCAMDCGPCQKWAKREGFVAFSTTLQYITLHYNYNFTTFYYTTLHYTTVHSITLKYTTLHYTTLHSTTLHYITLHYITLHYSTLHYLPLHYITLNYITLHYIPQHNNYNYTKLHYTTLHYTTLHSTTLHYTTLHYITLNDTAPQIDR